MIKPKYKLAVTADVLGSQKQYEIDWDKIALDVKDAALLVNDKEPTMKKKPGRKKKGY